MAKNPQRKQTAVTKKHLARVERERIQTRYILIGSITVIILVIGLIGYGVLEQNVLRGLRTVATVNGEKISANEFRDYTKYYRSNLINEANRVVQLAQLFGDNPSFSIVDQLSPIATNLDTYRAGEVALNQMVDDLLVRQEAAKRGITVSPEEVEKRLQEELGYFSEGKPTPTPTTEPAATSTLTSMQLTMMPRTPTPTATSVPTTTLEITSTATPTAEFTPTPTVVLTSTATPIPMPTETPFTLDAYQELYATVIADYGANYEVPEKTLRNMIESQLIREKLLKEVIGDIPCSEEQVWAQHILVEDEKLAKDIYNRLQEGEDWQLMAATYSTDESNKNTSGDLGWFSRGQMVSEFEEAAFSLAPGEMSQPVQSQFGWHVIRVLGHEERPITASACLNLKNQKFQEWLADIKEQGQVEILDFWKEVVPLNPVLPPEILQLLPEGVGGAPAGFPTSP
ncbi:MAG: peptidylprolyl isomerase [Anaerolineales bacterium]|nr:peptidylprolyl isomerase [Anaerolineales bacterium]